MCHKPKRPATFKHLVRATEERKQKGEADGLGGPEVDCEVNFRGLFALWITAVPPHVRKAIDSAHCGQSNQPGGAI
jgi:hypothetical protein